MAYVKDWYVPYFYEQKIRTSKAWEKNKKTKFSAEKDIFAPYTVYVRSTIEYQFTQNILTDLLVHIAVKHDANKSFDLTGPLPCIYSILHPKE